MRLSLHHIVKVISIPISIQDKVFSRDENGVLQLSLILSDFGNMKTVQTIIFLSPACIISELRLPPPTSELIFLRQRWGMQSITSMV